MSKLVTGGYNYYLNREYKKALDCAESALAEKSEDIKALQLKGNALLAMNLPLEAISCFNTIIKLNYNFLDAYIACAQAYVMLGDYKKAENCANSALHISERSYRAIFAWALKGFISYSLGKYQDSERYYINAKKLAKSQRYLRRPKEESSQIWCMLGNLSYRKIGEKVENYVAFKKVYPPIQI